MTDKTATHLVKNTADGPRGIATPGGVFVTLEPGEERVLELSDAEHKNAADYFKFSAPKAEKAPKAE